MSITELSDIVFGKPPSKITDCNSAHDVALLLGIEYHILSKLLYPTPSHSYRYFTIPKKNGSLRTIEAPKKLLKGLQRKLNGYLLDHFNPRPSAHGFIIDRSIVSNASMHTGKSFILNIDLENFFSSIHFGRIKKLFQSYPFFLSDIVATIIAQLCCNKGKLPQGSPTSPIISNMICHKLDREIQDLARKNQCTYSRYADDITFSFTGNKRNLPIDLIKLEEDGGICIGPRLCDIISKNGFKINGNKIRLQPYSQRQEVTGLIVNKSINVKREFIRKTQSMLHAWKKFGPVNAEIDYIDKYRKKKLLERHKLKIGTGEFFIKVVKGRINFIRMVRGADDIIYKKLAYQLTEAFGKPNYNFLKTKELIAVDSIFILENNLDVSQGTAFLIENVGVVTNFHVVNSINDANDTEVELYRYNELSLKRSVKFIKSSEEKDLAIFEPKSDFSGIKHLKIGDDSKLQQGSEVIVIGYPQHSPGAGLYIKASKVVQFRNYLGKNLWLIDSPIVHGNSGGPVFNSDMQVIGIATAGPETHTGDTIFNGFIPISELVQFALC